MSRPTIALTRPAVLAFGWLRAQQGEVYDPAGLVARSDTNRLTTRIRVSDAHGAPLCSGKLAFGSFGKRWSAVDAAGGPLLDLEVGEQRHTVTFADGRVATAAGRLFTPQWALTDSAGGTVVFPTGTEGPWPSAPDAWLLRQDGSLTFTQFVATVALYRRMRAQRRGSNLTD